MDTIKPMVLRGPLDWQPLPAPSKRSPLRWAVPVLVVAVLLVVGLEVTVPYYAVAPGTARRVNDLIEVPDDLAMPARGQFLLATVSLRRTSAFDAFRGWLDPETDVVPEEEVLGTTPRKTFTRQNLQLMDDSKNVAIVVALRRLGFPVAEQGTGALVVEVEDGSPADGHLGEGEVITVVDGQATLLSQTAADGIRARKPGDTIRLFVTGTDGATRTENVPLVAARDGTTAFLGVVLRTKEPTFDMPFDVTIDSGSIGGPSAGLAFTLGVLDALSPGELTGGRKVAVTGTIDIGGMVGDVGGVVQKTAAVRAAGATYFLVPPGEYDQAVAHAGDDLEVRKIASLNEAIRVLEELGGDALVTAQPPAPDQP